MTTPVWLMKTGNVFKLIWTWIKGHWPLMILSLAMIGTLIFARNKVAVADQLMKEFRDQQAQNAKELEELRKIQQEQIVKQQEINAKYNEVLDKIQRDYRDQLATLDVQKELDLRRIIATNKNDPGAMARDINTLFGIPIMETTPQSHT